MAITRVTSGVITDGTIANADLADDAVGVAELSATGTASSSTFLRGDNAWATAASGLPTQTDKDGYTLITDGTDASWAARSGRNLIINGAMQIAQRATSATGITTYGYNTVDRFMNQFGNLGTWTVTQEADGPAGFASSLKIDCTTADATPAAADNVYVSYTFEGFDCQSWKKGTASAESLTLSFWVKSFQTGTWQVNLRDYNNNRLVGGTYTVNASATWEYKTITFAPDTTGAITNNSSGNIAMEIWLDSGTNYAGGAVPTAWETRVNTDRNAGSTIRLGDSTNNYWQITGVQLEIGSTATPFEHKTYGQELADCQRYYEKSYNQGSNPGSATAVGAWMWRHTDAGPGVNTVSFQTPKRTTPTVVSYGRASGTSGKITNMSGGAADTTATAFNTGECSVTFSWTSTGSETYVEGHWTADAEL